MLANDGSYSHYDRWNPIFFITCRTWLPAPSWAEYHYEVQKGSVIKMQAGIFQAIRCYAQFSSKNQRTKGRYKYSAGCQTRMVPEKKANENS
jgi:hypothetical protein